MDIVFIAKKFDARNILSKKFDIYSKIFFRDVGNSFRHLCELVLRHQMRVSNYFVNSFYSVWGTNLWSKWRGVKRMTRFSVHFNVHIPLQIVILTRIPIPSRVYLIDTGNEGRAQDSRRPPPPATRGSISH